jgi:hypothetical protein
MSSVTSAPTSHLTFSLPMSLRPTSAEFAVEIRRSDMSFVTRVAASTGVDLPAGAYFVSLRQPAGGEEARRVVVGDGSNLSEHWSSDVDDRIALGETKTITFDVRGPAEQLIDFALQRKDLLALRNWSKNIRQLRNRDKQPNACSVGKNGRPRRRDPNRSGNTGSESI